MKLESHLEIYNIYRLLFQILHLYYKYKKLVSIIDLLVEVLKIIKDKIFKVYITKLIP